MNARVEMMRRIQVGLVGLVSVLLLVSVANFVLQRASDEQTAVEEIQDQTADGAEAMTDGDAAPAEPLVDLGITPAPLAEEDAANRPAPGARASGQVVPDLRPDPKLEAPMDRER